MKIDRNCLAFTFCQVPFVYRLSEHDKIIISMSSGQTETIPGLLIKSDRASSIFNRDDKIEHVDVYLNGDLIPPPG